MTSEHACDAVAAVTKRLGEFLTARLGADADVEVTGLRRSGQGSSRENWPFDACWRAPDGTTVRRQLLLRRDPPNSVVDTGRGAEFALLKALEATAVPAPAVCWLDDSGAELGRPSMIVNRYPGRADRAVLRDKDPLRLSEAGRVALARALCDMLADVHRVDVDETSVRGALPDPGTAPAEDELSRWERKLSAAELEPQPVLRWTAHWLRRHLPSPPVRQVLIHGDFRPANVLISGGEATVLLDWELAHLGDPLDDVGWYCTPLYRTEHFVPGAWQQEDFLRRYAERSGVTVDPEALRFWQTLAVFRLAIMALQAARAFCEGSDRPAAPAGALIRHLSSVLSETPAS
jgi:aminoglycoside phosphotransferase (APT) family kinase protein